MRSRSVPEPPVSTPEPSVRLFQTPIGDMRAVVQSGLLVDLGFIEAHDDLEPREGSGSGVLDVLQRELDRYLRGEAVGFSIPVRLSSSPFMAEVQRLLLDLPVGTTTSYSALAARMGRPGAARAVGMANARNPIAIVVPCHRVIGADGDHRGYAGGVWRKAWLLDHEGATLFAGVGSRA